MCPHRKQRKTSVDARLVLAIKDFLALPGVFHFHSCNRAAPLASNSSEVLDLFPNVPTGVANVRSHPRRTVARSGHATCPIVKNLKGQKALVTGANSGIGKGIAIALAHAGAHKRFCLMRTPAK